MAYMKYKELTRTFNFRTMLSVEKIPDFIDHYIEPGEEILGIYGTRADTCVFTTRKLILFDIGFIGGSKKIHMFYRDKVASSTIEYKHDSIILYLSFDSGYQSKIKFVGFEGKDKTEFRKIYLSFISGISVS